MSKALWLVLIVPIFFAFLFSGCASKPSLKQEMVQPAQLRIVTQCVPGRTVHVRHSGGQLAAIVLRYGSAESALALAAAPFAEWSVAKWQEAVEKEIYSVNLPRFHELVMEKFAENIGGEIPAWNPVIIDDQGISPASVKSLLRDPTPLAVLATRTNYSTSVHSCAPGLSTKHGLESRYYVWFYVKGKLVLEKSLKYQSDNEKGRYRKIEVFSENNWEYLKQEMEHAANVIALRLVDLVKEIRRAE